MIERRKSKDIWARLFLVINFIGLFVFFAALLVFHWAQPEFETLFDKFYQLDLRTQWNSTLVRYFAYTVVLGLGVSFCGLGLSLFRARRKTDHKNPIIVLGSLYLLLFIFWCFSVYR